jgi:response regulator NasT
MNLRVLLVDGDEERAASVRAALEASGANVVTVVADAPDLVALVRANAADVIVCDLDDPSRDALESMRALDRHEPRPVVVFAARGDADQIQAAIEAGVAAYVVEGLQPARVRPVLDVAIRRFRAIQALRAELEKTRSTLAERILIERAKGVLMQRRRLSEAEAYRLMRRMAMKRRQRVVHIAEAILSEK